MLFDKMGESPMFLKYIDIYEMDIFGKDYVKLFCEYLQKKKVKGIGMTTLNLINKEVSDDEIERLSKSLEGNTSLESIYMFDNKLVTDRSIPTLIKMIETTNLSDIVATSTSITDQREILMALAKNIIVKGFKTLSFRDS